MSIFQFDVKHRPGDSGPAVSEFWVPEKFARPSQGMFRFDEGIVDFETGFKGPYRHCIKSMPYATYIIIGKLIEMIILKYEHLTRTPAKFTVNGLGPF